MVSLDAAAALLLLCASLIFKRVIIPEGAPLSSSVKGVNSRVLLDSGVPGGVVISCSGMLSRGCCGEGRRGDHEALSSENDCAPGLAGLKPCSSLKSNVAISHCKDMHFPRQASSRS